VIVLVLAPIFSLLVSLLVVGNLSAKIAARDETIQTMKARADEDAKIIVDLNANALTTAMSLTDCTEKLREAKEDSSL
jgi:phage-related tail protein